MAALNLGLNGLRVPFTTRDIRTQRFAGGLARYAVLPAREAVRRAVLDYYSAAGDSHLDDSQDINELDRYYGVRRVMQQVAQRFPAVDRALFIDWVEARQAGAGRAIHEALVARAVFEGARWSVLFSARTDEHRSPRGFWERLGYTVLHVDPREADVADDFAVMFRRLP